MTIYYIIYLVCRKQTPAATWNWRHDNYCVCNRWANVYSSVIGILQTGKLFSTMICNSKYFHILFHSHSLRYLATTVLLITTSIPGTFSPVNSPSSSLPAEVWKDFVYCQHNLCWVSESRAVFPASYITFKSKKCRARSGKFCCY